MKLTGVPEGMFYAYAACISFSILFNLRGRRLFLTALGSAVGWGMYLLLRDRIHLIMLTFLCISVLAIYAEIMAVIDKCPMTVYLIVGYFPFVPGAELYYTMKHLVDGDISSFLVRGLNTLGIALAMSVAVAVVMYGFTLIQTIRQSFKQRRDQKRSPL